MKVRELFEADVKHVNFDAKKGARGEMTPISMMQAFGSKEENALADNGIKFREKPGYWEELDDKPISEIALKKAEKIIGKIKEYTAKEVYGSDFVKGPQATCNKMPAENVVVIKFDDGRKYLADTTQANTYIRMWVKVATGVRNEGV
jgi:hypothetical protein